MNDPTTKTDSTTATRAVRSTIAAALLATGVLSVALPAHAALPSSNALLTINQGVATTDANGNVLSVTGSWFGMDTNANGIIANSEKTVIGQGTTGLIMGVTTSAGASHSGAPTASDTNAITAPWAFFGNTGSDYIRVAPTVLSTPTTDSATVDFSGWTVTWNGIVAINMGGVAWGAMPNVAPWNAAAFQNGKAYVTCTSGTFTCADSENYSLDYTATVPVGDPSGFGGVKYKLHLEGIVVTTLRALNDSAVTTVGNPVDINVLKNDAALNGIDPTSVSIVTPPANGTVSVNSSGVVRYTPNGGYNGTDPFTYTFKDKTSPTPLTSNPATVSVNVQVNVAPTANNDTATVIVGTSTAINVLANDTDPNGTTSLGNIKPATVTVTQPANPLGTVSVDPTTGVVTYTAGTTAGADSFTYTVQDADNATSNTATVNVTVQPWSGDWTNPIGAGTVPMLVIESGSYFTMQMTPTNALRTNLFAGADSGVILGMPQYAAGSHTGAPNASEVTGVDQPWSFFGNTGMHFTAGAITPNTGDGTLDFTNWRVTWNGIPAINMGGSSGQDSPVILGKAAIICSPAPCGDGSTYTLNYMAHVPPGDPSGFGGVPYGLHLVGHVRFLNTTLTGSGITGTINPGVLALGTTRVTAAQVAPDTDPRANAQCVGDCFDFQVGISGARAKVVLPLKVGIRPNSVYRKYYGGAWHDFDITTVQPDGFADTIKSAPLLQSSGLITKNCPAAGDGSYVNGLVAGNRCVQLDIADGGTNDADGSVNTSILDPSGVGAPAVVVTDTRTTGSSGCSLSADPVSVLQRADWLLLIGFVAWLGLVARRKRAS